MVERQERRLNSQLRYCPYGHLRATCSGYPRVSRDPFERSSFSPPSVQKWNRSFANISHRYITFSSRRNNKPHPMKDDRSPLTWRFSITRLSLVVGCCSRYRPGDSSRIHCVRMIHRQCKVADHKLFRTKRAGRWSSFTLFDSREITRQTIDFSF